MQAAAAAVVEPVGLDSACAIAAAEEAVAEAAAVDCWQCEASAIAANDDVRLACDHLSIVVVLSWPTLVDSYCPPESSCSAIDWGSDGSDNDFHSSSSSARTSYASQVQQQLQLRSSLVALVVVPATETAIDRAWPHSPHDFVAAGAADRIDSHDYARYCLANATFASQSPAAIP